METDFYNRETFLRERLNTFLARELRLPEADYYANLTDESLLSLKSVLADINNIFTLRVCINFVDWLASRFNFNEIDTQAVRASLLKTKPGANGYDIHIPTPIRAIAEIKCNVPINRGNKYGSNQRDGIKKDVTALLQGKSKARLNLHDYLKFLVLLDRPAIRAATEHFRLGSKLYRDRLIVVSDAIEIDRQDVVYVVYVSPPSNSL
ncbi:MAG TPA: hypothetical protein VHS31_00320 [Tepidisphaeraceae bacterium]|jgi:hypothetical protein|nr:hypothetical protein [Tepidisphaeraceae bacterium]